MSDQPLAPDEIRARLAEVPDWDLQENQIERELTFANFREAIAFLTLIAFDAEEADHHPDITVNYKRLGLALTTHSAGGLTAKDFDLARVIDAHFERWPG